MQDFKPKAKDQANYYITKINEEIQKDQRTFITNFSVHPYQSKPILIKTNFHTR